MKLNCPECGSEHVDASEKGVRFEKNGDQFSWFRCVNCGYNWEVHLGYDRDRRKANKYEQLRVAVQDLLSELRIDEGCLRVMALGYSPDYPGGTAKELMDNLKKISLWKDSYCKVQLSKVVAQKLIDAGVIGDD